MVTFLINHSDDAEYSSPNQSFWTQYDNDDNCYNLSNATHPVRPTNNESIYFEHNQLKPECD